LVFLSSSSAGEAKSEASSNLVSPSELVARGTVGRISTNLQDLGELGHTDRGVVGEKSPLHSLTEQRSRIDSGSHNWGYGRGTFEAVL